ncbi:MAG: FCD domain-containing protein [Nocardioides sp.]
MTAAAGTIPLTKTPPGAAPDPKLLTSLRAEIRANGTGAETRSEYAASLLAALAERSDPGARLGTKVELREWCEVSVGTFNEAVKLTQSRGYITSRPGPGGGIFASEQTMMVRLGNSVLALDGSATAVADAVRMRDALDPLLVDDALWHSSATDLLAMRECLESMAAAVKSEDPTAFIRGNWALHARIAEVSPSAVLKSVYLGLLELVEKHTLAVHATEAQPLPEFIAYRYRLHESLVDAIETRDRTRALELIHEHNTTDTPT